MEKFKMFDQTYKSLKRRIADIDSRLAGRSFFSC
jgi:hypothetical protein